MANKKPIDRFRDGKLEVTIWENQGENGAFYSTDLTRSYKDSDGWKQTKGGFSGAELLRAADLFRRAYVRELELRQADRQDDTTE